MRRPTPLVMVLLLAALALTACAAGPNDVSNAGVADLAGFWQGLWHGLIAPITFLISLFNDHVSVYEVHNNGNWYDTGFIIGVAAIFSGGASGRSASSRRRA